MNDIVELRGILDKLVAGLRVDSGLWFDGPPTNHVMGKPYFTLSMNGRVGEGASDPAQDVASLVISNFILQLAAELEGATQVAWRSRPSIESFGGQYRAKCRLAVFKGGTIPETDE